jgi:curved DNA-binding protein CbpA
MGTLYDLLGALPDDDSEELRAAFRKAAKATHPDVNPDDPDAPSKFRQLVRAQEILCEPEQRATYDLLLALAVQEASSNTARATIYEKIYKHASNTLAATIMAAMMVGGYALLGTVSKAPVIPKKVTESAAKAPVEVADATPAATASDALDRSEPADKPERPEVRDEVILTSAVAPANAAPAVTAVEPAPKPATNDAKSYLEQGIFAYRDGDLYRALTDFDLAIERDPHFAGAYVNRGIIWYRMHEFERAYADLAQAKRLKNAGKPRISAAATPPRKPSPVAIREASKDAGKRPVVEARGFPGSP